MQFAGRNIAVTLAESQGKKAAFLSEALRVLEIRNAKVHSRRAEELPSVFDCVTLRAVDKMEFAVRMAGKLVREGGWLALMTTREELVRLKDAIRLEYSWPEAMQPSGNDNRVAPVMGSVSSIRYLDERQFANRYQILCGLHHQTDTGPFRVARCLVEKFECGLREFALTGHSDGSVAQNQ